MKQAQLDREGIKAGKDRYWKNNDTAVAKGRESETMACQRLIDGALPGLIEALEAWIAEANTGKAGRAHNALAALTACEPSLICLLGFQAILDNVGTSPSYSRMTNQIGRSLECEARMHYYREADLEFYKHLERRAKAMQMIDPMFRYNFFHQEFKRHIEEQKMLDYEPWKASRRVSAGAVFLEITTEVTGLIYQDKDFSKNPKRPTIVIRPTESMGKWIAGFHAYAELLRPVFLPRVQKPEPWGNRVEPEVGTDQTPYAIPMVKTYSRSLIAHLEDRDLSQIADALNALQETPWRINRTVFDVAQSIWGNDLQVAGIERRSPLPLPVVTDAMKDDEEAMKHIRRERGRIRTSNAKTVGRTIASGKTLAVADMLKEERALYFPHQADFRGRMYPVPTYLQPQGSDLAKGLLEFGEGKAIMHPHQADWLAIHCANTFGEDKLSMDERIAWTLSHRDDILALAADPHGNRWWTEADSPFQFLAAALEWARWLDVGIGMVSHLPVGVDGTNNGLQILSLLCRDEESGRATNVLPSNSHQDIYGDVAKLVTRELTDIVSKGEGDDRWIADFWLRWGIDRKTCKRPVMTFAYGSTFSSCMAYADEWFEESCEKRQEVPFTDRVQKRKATTFLAKKVWEAIHVTVDRPKAVMEWLRHAARDVCQTKEPVEWTTPHGLLVQQRYMDPKTITVETLLRNSVKKIRLTAEGTTLSKRRQVNGIAPNYVHSLDATALAMTVQTALKMGVDAFHMIHDSYGTHAACMDELAASLRHAFSTLFSRDLLAELKAELEERFELTLEPLPDYGGLNPKAVLESEFFFA